MASVLRYFTLNKIQHSKFCLNYCKENVANLIQLFSWQYLAVCTMHNYGIKNTCLWNHREGKGKLLVFPHTWMYIALCGFPIVFYSLSSLSEHWIFSEDWSCAVGTCAGESACWAMGARKTLRKVEWRWDEGRWFDLRNQVVFFFCWKFLIVARAQWLGRWLKWACSCLAGKKALIQVWEGDGLVRHCHMQ